MTGLGRKYPYDGFYDHLDRSALVAILEDTYGQDPEDVRALTRTELIDWIIDISVEAESDAEEMGEDYPLRRPSQPNDLSGLRQIRPQDGNHVYWCWMADWEAAAESLIGDLMSISWGLPASIQPGDVIVTAVASEPPLVVCVELVEHVENGTVFVEPRWTIDQPVPVVRVERKLGALLPMTTTVLADESGEILLDLVADLLEHPDPTFMVAGDCVPDGRRKAGSAVHALRILQDQALECAACGAQDDHLQLHYFRPRHVDLQLEIQDHLDDTSQLCSACHRLCHSPTLKQLRGIVLPTPLECPECGGRNPRQYIWGMPGDPGALNSDDVVIGGCALPSGPRPEYQCRACDTDFSVVRTRDAEGLGF